MQLEKYFLLDTKMKYQCNKVDDIALQALGKYIQMHILMSTYKYIYTYTNIESCQNTATIDHEN